MNLRLATLQRLLILGVIALAIAYLAVLRPLAQRVIEEDAPLQELRNRLSQAILRAGLPRETSLPDLEKYLRSLRAAAADFATIEHQARPRLELPPEVRRRLEEPFQLVEFLNESQRRLEELAALAQSGRVALTPGLPRGFPRYQPELARPELLWVQLATVNRLVQTAIRAGVREVAEVSVESLPMVDTGEIGPQPLPGPAAPPPTTNAWSALRVHLTAIGSVDALAKLLVALALTPEELKAAGLPAELGAQPALFIDHLLLRRHQLEAAEQARVEVVVSTVVPTETP